MPPLQIHNCLATKLDYKISRFLRYILKKLIIQSKKSPMSLTQETIESGGEAVIHKVDITSTNNPVLKITIPGDFATLLTPIDTFRL